MEVGTQGKARKRKAGRLWLRALGGGLPPVFLLGEVGAALSSVSAPAWGWGGGRSHLRKRGKREEAGGARTRHQHPSFTSPLAQLRPEPSVLQRRRPGLRAPGSPTVLRPGRSLGWCRPPHPTPRPPDPPTPGSPRRRHISAPARGALRPAHRGSRDCGRPGGSAPILVGGRSAASAPRPLPAGSPARRHRGLPSRHPPGGPARGGPWLASGRSDRLGSPSWPARLSHSAGPTPRPPAWHSEGAPKLQPGLVKSLLCAPARTTLLKDLLRVFKAFSYFLSPRA